MTEIIDVEVKELMDDSTEKFLAVKKEEFLGFAKRTIESYLETGRVLCEVNERLASHSPTQSRWSTWLEEVGVPGRTAREIMSVYRKYGLTSAVTAGVTSTQILVALSSPSADPELVAEVETRLQAGEKITVAEVKDILKKIPEEVLQEARYEIIDEERYDEPIEQIKAFREKQASDFQKFKEDADITKKEAKVSMKKTFFEMAMVAKNEFNEVSEWIKNAQQFYQEHGVEPPPFELQGNLLYNVGYVREDQPVEIGFHDH